MIHQLFLKNKKLLLILYFFLFNIFIIADEFNFSPEINEYIYDCARILTNTDKNTLNNKLQYLKIKKDIIFMLVIFNSMPIEDEYLDFEDFSRKYFDKSGLNKKNNNLMFIMSIKDRKLKVQLGEYYNKYYQLKIDKVLNDKAIPYFKNNNYNIGIYNAVNDIIKIVSSDIDFFKYYKNYIISCLLIIFFILFIIMISFLKKRNKPKTINNFGNGSYGRWT